MSDNGPSRPNYIPGANNDPMPSGRVAEMAELTRKAIELTPPGASHEEQAAIHEKVHSQSAFKPHGNGRREEGSNTR